MANGGEQAGGRACNPARGLLPGAPLVLARLARWRMSAAGRAKRATTRSRTKSAVSPFYLFAAQLSTAHRGQLQHSVDKADPRRSNLAFILLIFIGICSRSAPTSLPSCVASALTVSSLHETRGGRALIRACRARVAPASACNRLWPIASAGRSVAETDDFSSVFVCATAAANAGFRCTPGPMAACRPGFGLVVANAPPSAPWRNYIKRTIREVFARQQPALDGGFCRARARTL